MLFDHTAKLGGGEIALLELVRNFDRKLVTPIVVLAAHGPLAESLQSIAETHIVPLGGEILEARKDELGSGSLTRLKQIAGSLAYVFRLAGFIRAHRIDLVHTNSLKADILGGLAAKLSRRPLIWHVRDRIADDYLPRPVVRIFRRLCRILPDFIIGNSNATLDTLHLDGRVPSQAVVSGVDMNAFPDRDTETCDGEIRIGIIGRLCEWKGQHIFLQAAAALAPEFPRARFEIIGAPLFGEEAYETELRRQCTSLGLDEVVDFLGFRRDIGHLIQQLNVVVHASITGEPLGQVILQGMAAGKPVVATNGGGVPEIMVHGKTGYLVPMGEVAPMADAIRDILQSSDLGKGLGRNGRQHVFEWFTIGRSVNAIETIYRRLVGESSS
jgi:glycosyltransferase involved in cell wall biosynthesis